MLHAKIFSYNSNVRVIINVKNCVFWKFWKSFCLKIVIIEVDYSYFTFTNTLAFYHIFCSVWHLITFIVKWNEICVCKWTSKFWKLALYCRCFSTGTDIQNCDINQNVYWRIVNFSLIKTLLQLTCYVFQFHEVFASWVQ